MKIDWPWRRRAESEQHLTRVDSREREVERVYEEMRRAQSTDALGIAVRLALRHQERRRHP